MIASVILTVIKEMFVLLPETLLPCATLAYPVEIGRLKYGGGDWYANPTSINRLLHEFEKRTGLKTAQKEKIADPSSPSLFDVKLLHMTGHGQVWFTQKEKENLRKFFKNGGFLHADDNYGMDRYFRKAMKELFPDLRLERVPNTHPIYTIFYQLPGLPKIHLHHGGPPEAYAVYLDGRMIVFYTYNTDISDGWEAPEVHNDPPEKREKAFEMGVNIFLYALLQDAYMVSNRLFSLKFR